MTPWPHHVTINIISAVPLSTLARSAVLNMTQRLDTNFSDQPFDLEVHYRSGGLK
jgi:enoyl-[acyl-carrier-protein] reductase (NADH)